MQIAVLGTGTVGRTIAPRLAELGHVVRLGTRDPATTRAREGWSDLPGVELCTFAAATPGADLVVHAGSGASALDLLGQAGDLKSLNTLTAELMAHPDRLPEPTSVFVSGDDPDAKRLVAGLLAELGHRDVIDLGGIETSRGVEMWMPLWLRLMGSLGTAEFNLKVVRAT